MCESFFRITTFDKHADCQGFHRGLQEASAGWYGKHEGENRLRKSITSIMLDLLVLSREHGIWPQRDVVKYIRSAIALDGLVKTFAPGLDIGLQLEQACERHVKWASLQELISPEAAIGCFGSYAHLVRDGLLRALAVLRKVAVSPQQITAPFQSRPKKHPFVTLLQVGWAVSCGSLIWKPAQAETIHIAVILVLLLAGIWLVASRREGRGILRSSS
jgi:hypothetical protein